MQWTESADDRAFLRQLSREIIAAVAPAELEEFDSLIAGYFANPCPPRPGRRRKSDAASGPTPLTPATPGVLSALLNLLLMEIQESGPYDLPDVARLGLKRLLRQRVTHSHERIWLPPAGKHGQRALALLVYLYTQPVAIRVTVTRLAEVGYQAAGIYGLDDASADTLVPAVIARLSLGQG